MFVNFPVLPGFFYIGRSVVILVVGCDGHTGADICGYKSRLLDFVNILLYGLCGCATQRCAICLIMCGHLK